MTTIGARELALRLVSRRWYEVCPLEWGLSGFQVVPESGVGDYAWKCCGGEAWVLPEAPAISRVECSCPADVDDQGVPGVVLRVDDPGVEVDQRRRGNLAA